jgi:hypothetical protein
MQIIQKQKQQQKNKLAKTIKQEQYITIQTLTI